MRRTEYTSSQGPQHISSGTANRDLARLRNDPKRRKLSNHKEDPLNIIRHIVKGFDVAYPKDAYKGDDSTSNIRGAAITDPEIKAWSNVKHPSKPELSLLDSYPVLPDLEALPPTSWYMVMKFITNPVAAGDSYDERLDAAILRPKDDKHAFALYNQKLEEWKAESGKPRPLPEDDYDYYLPVEATSTRAIKRKLNVNDPENGDDELYTDDLPDGGRAFAYSRIRTYETYTQNGDPDRFYEDSVALALHDPETEVGAVLGTKQRLAKAAYFYPVMQRTALRPKRKLAAMGPSQVTDDETVDVINLTIADMDEYARAHLAGEQAKLDPSMVVDAPLEVEAAA